MNKRQKEVIQAQLDSEKAVLEQLEKHYARALRDIDNKIRILQSDELTQSRIYRLEYQKALKEQVKGVLEKLHSDEYTTIQQFLSASYTDAFVGTAYDLFGQGVPLIMPIDPDEAVKAVLTDSKISKGLYNALGVDVNKLKKSISAEISRGVAGGMSLNEIARNISSATKAPMSRARTIVQTESHRIQQAARQNARLTAKSKGAEIVKQWNSTLDGETRDTHRKLDGQIRELDEPFEVGGMKAMYPGDFGDPAEDCNCRCETLQRAKWALGEAELETLKERAAFFELDKTDDFESFKMKYVKAVQTVEKAEKENETVTNKFGQVVIFDEKMRSEKWSGSAKLIKELTNEYDTRLTSVKVGAESAAGSVGMGGEMRLSSRKPEVAIHEFAHSITLENLTKYGVEDQSSFWKEVKSVRRAYRKNVGDDSDKWISAYEHSNKSVDEFFAEAFTMAKMVEKDMELPPNYGRDLTYAQKILEITDKYFKKRW